jgi:hypothetical protein
MMSPNIKAKKMHKTPDIRRTSLAPNPTLANRPRRKKKVDHTGLVNRVSEHSNLDKENIRDQTMAQNILLKPFSELEQEDDLDAIPVVKCPICFKFFEGDEEVAVLKTCQHAGHKECIKKWILDNFKDPKCPTCFSKIKQE